MTTISVVLSIQLGACSSSHGPSPSNPPTDDSTTEPLTPDLDLARELATRFIHRHPARRLDWSWENAIFTFALARLAEVDDSTEWPTYLHDVYQRPPPRIRRPDDCAPALAAALMLQRNNSATRTAVEQVAAYLHDVPRNELGALDHLDRRTALGRLYPASIWVDSLVMYALTAALVGQSLREPELVAFAHAQPVVFATHLQDPTTGLFRHAYLHERGHTRPEDEVFWLRGNGWVALALVELLATMEPEQPEYVPTRAILRRLAEGLVRHRTRAGTWTTIIDAPRTYEETSGTALVAHALAKGARLGLLPAEYRTDAQLTMRTLESRIRHRRSGPVLPGISGPTIPSRTAGYAVVPRRPNLAYGVGAYLLLAAELSQPGRAPSP